MRLSLLASGDFACNLYWQSASLFLLFFYTDILRLPPGVAGLLYMAGALWDGVAGLLVGMVVQRQAIAYRRIVAWGSAPLGIAFALLYLPGSPFVVVVATQIAFRTLYAIVNVPYAAWSARISEDSRDRTILAGLRMLFGTAAAILVALATPGIARTVAGGMTREGGFFAAAIVFAAVAVPLLVAVARTAPEATPSGRVDRDVSIASCARALAANRAFVTLSLAAVASTVAAATLTQSVLYYFSHVVADAAAGPSTLAMMAVAGSATVPLWMAGTARGGVRAAWFAAVAIGLAATALFVAVGGSGRGPTVVFLVTMQVALTGFNLGFWAMLPDTVEYGERTSGVRVEAMAFGVAALIQKMALAAAIGGLGLFYGHIGYSGQPVADAAVARGIRLLMLAGPATGLTLSALFMMANPLRRGVHAVIVADLRGPRPVPGSSGRHQLEAAAHPFRLRGRRDP